MIKMYVTVQNTEVFGKVNGMLRHIPDEMGEVNYDVAKLYQRNLRYQLSSNRSIWTKNLWNSIKAQKISDTESVVSMPDYGLFLDKMKPHYVKMRRGSLLYMWALTKSGVSPEIQEMALHERSIRVHAHPFIEQALMRSRPRIRGIAEKRLRTALTMRL